MDFFEHQDRARKRTGLLLFYFFLAVALTVLAVNAALWLVSGLFGLPRTGFGTWLAGSAGLTTTLGTLAVIGLGSLVRYLSLRGGGEAVAQAVGARRLDPASGDAHERVLLNVVEEMAIASGVPAPSVWVMDYEAGINAFVAGFEPTEAVLVVTRGALDSFTRDELQGVVGHEFSHVLNGDMRLNVQLYAILAGILLIGKIGEFLLRSGRGRDSRGQSGAVVVGLALFVTGYIGLFFGRLIKAAISRQREFLADASSVQFTRNPAGIGEALLRIRNHNAGTLLDSAQAEDMSHMCIAQPVQLRLASLLATHPPLDARIAAIDPALFARDRARQRTASAAASASVLPDSPAAAGFAGGTPAAVTGTAIVASVGTLQPAHVAHAAGLVASIPKDVRAALRRPDSARAVLYGLLCPDPAQDDAALALLAARDAPAAALLPALLPAVRRLGTRLRLPCHDLALPTLKALPDTPRAQFLATLEQLVRLDGKVTLREYLSLALLRKHLAADAGARRPVRHRSYRSVEEPLDIVFSLLSHAAGGTEAGRSELHRRILRGFGVADRPLQPMASLGADRLHAALAELADLSPLLKKPLLDACVDCVRHDGRVQVAELELVRAIGDTLDCPVPPLVG